jgi:hypothetical protein
MTVRYTYLDIDFEPYVGPNPRSTGVFVKSDNAAPIVGELGKDWWPEGSPRQSHFEAQIRRISAALNSRCVPAHLEWRSGERNQLDKGCIGHSFVGETSFIESVARNSRDEITHIVLRNFDGGER